jgi:hypothetical protein
VNGEPGTADGQGRPFALGAFPGLARMIHDLVEHRAIPLRFPGISPSVVLARRQVLLRASNDDLPETRRGLTQCLLRS